MGFEGAAEHCMPAPCSEMLALLQLFMFNAHVARLGPYLETTIAQGGTQMIDSEAVGRSPRPVHHEVAVLYKVGGHQPICPPHRLVTSPSLSFEHFVFTRPSASTQQLSRLMPRH